MTATLPVDDRAAPDRGLHPLLASRWSPRSFDPSATLDPGAAARILAAARWAPSASNTQPWRFLLAPRGTAQHQALLDALAPFNQVWAGDAAALILLAAQAVGADGAPLRYSTYDTGQAAAYLTIQAESEGLAVHQMAGFDRDAVSAQLGLPSEIAPLVVAAIGPRAAADRLPEQLAARERAPRSRNAVADLLLPGSWHPTEQG